MSKLVNDGVIEIICGPMYAGKSEELIRKLNRLSIAKIDLLCFKPKIDTRSEDTFVSRNGKKFKSITIDKPIEIFDYLKDSTATVIAIDEVQFFDESIVNISKFLSLKGYHLILSGLDKNYKGEPFGPIPQLLSISDYVTKLTAVCTQCGSEALYTQRIINGSVANHNDDLILIGDNESYEARCRQHFEYHDPKLIEYELIFKNCKK